MICGGVQTSCRETIVQLLTIGLANGAIIALNAISVSLIYSLVRVINFAHGDMFALLSVLASVLVGALGLHSGMAFWQLGLGMLVVLGLTMLAGMSASVAVERVGFRPFRGGSRLAPLMATLGISFMLYQAALFVRTLTNAVIKGEHRSVPGIPEVARIDVADVFSKDNLVTRLGIQSSIVIQSKDLVMLGLAIVVALAMWWFLARTRLGAMIRSCAYDPTMAQLCGINYTHTIRLVFALGGALAGIAAVAYATYYTSPYTNYGAASGLIAFTAAIIGGIGKPLGALWSSLLLGIISAFSDYFIAAAWTPAILLGLLIILLVIRGKGAVAIEHNTSDAIASDQVRRPKRWHRWAMIGCGILLLIAPWINNLFNLGLLVTLTNIVIFALLAFGLNITVGWTGMLDLGYVACFALGAYVVGLLGAGTGGIKNTLASGDVFLILLFAGGFTALVGMGIGALTKRLSNESMALATFALAVIVQRTLYNWRSLTDGASGVSGIPHLRVLGWSLDNPIVTYYAVCAITAVIAWLGWNLLRSHLGRGLAAISHDEVAAASVGVPVVRLKTLAFALSGAIAGIGGALFATSFSYFSPNNADFRVSALVLIMVVIAGSRRLIAPMIGAVIVTAYDLLVIPNVGDYFDRLRESSGNWFWAMINPRGANFLAFGLLLYLTVWYRGRVRNDE